MRWSKLLEAEGLNPITDVDDLDFSHELKKLRALSATLLIMQKISIGRFASRCRLASNLRAEKSKKLIKAMLDAWEPEVAH